MSEALHWRRNPDGQGQIGKSAWRLPPSLQVLRRACMHKAETYLPIVTGGIVGLLRVYFTAVGG